MKRIRPWLGAALASIVLNLVFFSLMPLMTRQEKNIAVKTIRLNSQVNIVRLKEPEPDPEIVKKENRQPENRQPDSEQKNRVQNMEQPPRPAPKRQFHDFPALDFTVNPDLPATPRAPVFPMERVVFSPRVMDKIYTGADIDNAIVPRVHMPPVYPFQAKRRGIEGWVRVRFLVNTHGEVEDISILESSPRGVFDQSVLSALPRWKFAPGTIQGVAVKTRVETTIRFELEK